MTSLHAIFAQNQANIQTATSPSIIKQFQIVKHQKTQNNKVYKVAISKFKVVNFLPCNFQKINFREKYSIKFSKINIFKKLYNMCVMCVLTIYMTNFRSIGSKMTSKSFENVHMKYFQIRLLTNENSIIELHVKFCIKTMLFEAKITALKFSPFLPGSLRFMS